MSASGFSESFYAAVAEFLRVVYRKDDVAQIVNVTEDTDSGGFCETCWYEETVLRIAYKTPRGELMDVTVYESFETLIRSLTGPALTEKQGEH